MHVGQVWMHLSSIYGIDVKCLSVVEYYGWILADYDGNNCSWNIYNLYKIQHSVWADGQVHNEVY